MHAQNAKRGRAYDTSDEEGTDDDSRLQPSFDGRRTDEETTETETAGEEIVTPRGRHPDRVPGTGIGETRRNASRRGFQPSNRFGWVGTWNNPPQPHALLLEYLTRYVYPKVDYFTGQYEMGSRAGTLHVQFYLEMASRRTLSTMVKLFHFAPGLAFSPHIEAKSPFSTFTQAKEYTEKAQSRVEGTERFDYGEWRGEPISTQGKRNDMEEIARLARDGKDMRTIGEMYPGQVIRYFGGISKYQSLFQPKRNWEMDVRWFWGPTGAGKSRAAAELMPDAYYKDGGTKWWDNYLGESDVIIDDFRFNANDHDVSFSYLLRLTDRYPMQVQSKGGSHQFCARRIIFTSPQSPEATFAGVSEHVGQLLRRITEIKYFDVEPRTNIIN